MREYILCKPIQGYTGRLFRPNSSLVTLSVNRSLTGRECVRPSQCSPVVCPKPSLYASQFRKKFTEPSSLRWITCTQRSTRTTGLEWADLLSGVWVDLHLFVVCVWPRAWVNVALPVAPWACLQMGMDPKHHSLHPWHLKAVSCIFLYLVLWGVLMSSKYFSVFLKLPGINFNVCSVYKVVVLVLALVFGGC